MKSERRKWKKLTFVVIFTTLAFVSVGCASVATLPEEEWNMTFGGQIMISPTQPDKPPMADISWQGVLGLTVLVVGMHGS